MGGEGLRSMTEDASAVRRENGQSGTMYEDRPRETKDELVRGVAGMDGGSLACCAESPDAYRSRIKGLPLYADAPELPWYPLLPSQVAFRPFETKGFCGVDVWPSALRFRHRIRATTAMTSRPPTPADTPTMSPVRDVVARLGSPDDEPAPPVADAGTSTVEIRTESLPWVPGAETDDVPGIGVEAVPGEEDRGALVGRVDANGLGDGIWEVGEDAEEAEETAGAELVGDVVDTGGPAGIALVMLVGGPLGTSFDVTGEATGDDVCLAFLVRSRNDQ